jgi:hypothetical protein
MTSIGIYSPSLKIAIQCGDKRGEIKMQYNNVYSQEVQVNEQLVRADAFYCEYGETPSLIRISIGSAEIFGNPHWQDQWILDTDDSKCQCNLIRKTIKMLDEKVAEIYARIKDSVIKNSMKSDYKGE